MKKTLKKLSFILALLVFAALSQIAYAYNKIDNALVDYRIFSQSEKIQKIIQNYKVVECEFNLLKPVHSIVAYKHYSEDRQTYDVAFYSPTRSHILSTNWQIEYTGGTDVKTTTFPELVKMVKKDCSQFQHGYDNPDPSGSSWTYAKYTEEPPETQEEKDRRDATIVLKDFKDLTEVQQNKIIKNYGSYKGLTAKEIIGWEVRITEGVESGKFSLE